MKRVGNDLKLPDSPMGWAVLILKVLLYVAGLLMAGYGTAEAANLQLWQ